MLAAATAALALVDGPYTVLVLLSVAAGLARGIMTLLQATAVPDRWGTLGLGRHNGLLAAPAMVASAAAPFVAALLAGPLGGLDGVFLLPRRPAVRGRRPRAGDRPVAQTVP